MEKGTRGGIFTLPLWVGKLVCWPMIAEQQQEVMKVGGLEQRNQTILIFVHAVGIVSSVYRVRGSAVIAYK